MPWPDALRDQVAKVCKEQGAGDVKLFYADLTDPREAQKLGEVRALYTPLGI